jgi:hypothetical protein
MSAAKWSKRLKREGRRTILIPLGLAVIVVCVNAISLIFHHDHPVPGFVILLMLIPMLIPGVILWLVGWYMEGFAEGARENSPRNISVS